MANAFRAWVSEVGIPEVAKQLGKSQHGVRHWLSRRAYPQVETMRLVVKLSRGKVSLDSIVEACRPDGGKRA